MTTDEVVEAAETELETKEESKDFDGLSMQDALKKAYDQHKDELPGQKAAETNDAPTTKEVKKELAEEVEPPAEFSAAGKKAWKDKDIAGIQKEYRRVHDGRTQEIGRLQTESRKAREEAEREKKEASTWRELGKRAAPYIEARGKEGVTADQAILEALRLIDAFKNADPATAKAELKAIGIDLDSTAGKKASAEIPDEYKKELSDLRSELNSIKQKEEEQTYKNVAGVFNSVFGKMGSEKNRVGENLYPDLQDSSEEGMVFAKRLGSFAFNPEFQAGVKRRFPDADFEKVVREAYSAAGGRVSGEVAKVSESNQGKIDRSRRAAASTPGRVAPQKDTSSLIGKLSIEEATRQAYRDHQEH